MTTHQSPPAFNPAAGRAAGPPAKLRHHLRLLRWFGLFAVLAIVLVSSQAGSRSASAAGPFTITPSSWDFGSAKAGQPVTELFTVTNNGNTAALQAFSIANSLNFYFAGGTCDNISQLAPGESCTFIGTFSPHTPGPESGSLGFVFDTGTTSVNVTGMGLVGPPMVGQGFPNSDMPLNGTIGLNFSISNPNNATALSGVGFSETLPAGLEVASPNFVSTSCATGTITAVPGSNVISYAAGVLNPSAGCSVTLSVKATSLGKKTSLTNAPTSVQSGAGIAAVAYITVFQPASLPALKDAVNNSSALPQYKTVLTSMVNSAQSYLSLNTPYGKSAACSSLNSFKSMASIYAGIAQATGITSGMGASWNAIVDAVRATIPC